MKIIWWNTLPYNYYFLQREIILQRNEASKATLIWSVALYLTLLEGLPFLVLWNSKKKNSMMSWSFQRVTYESSKRVLHYRIYEFLDTNSLGVEIADQILFNWKCVGIFQS